MIDYDQVRILELRNQLRSGSEKPTKGAPPSREQQIRGLLANIEGIEYSQAVNHMPDLTLKEYQDIRGAKRGKQ
jgi:hypothetical protein